MDKVATEIAQKTMQYPFKIWGFGEGIALEALWLAGNILNEPRYHRFVLDCFERWLQRKPSIEESDHSAPGALLLQCYEATSDQRYLSLAQRLAEHMLSLPHDSSGAAFHRPQHPAYHHFIYVDCMEVDAPFLCKLASVTGNKHYFDDAARQLLAYSTLLRDSATGLFSHQYDGETGAVNGTFWGRGNGWALLGMLKTLELLPSDHAAFTSIQQQFIHLVASLANLQHPSGEWSTVLDQPNTYCEASLTAIFGYAIQIGINRKLLDERYLPVAKRAWSATQQRLTDGILEGVSIATPPGDATHYNSIANRSWLSVGTGPRITLCISLSVVERTPTSVS